MVNSGITQFHTQFTQVSRLFLALNTKQKIVLQMWSQICGKMAMLVHNGTLKKSAKKVETY